AHGLSLNLELRFRVPSAGLLKPERVAGQRLVRESQRLVIVKRLNGEDKGQVSTMREFPVPRPELGEQRAPEPNGQLMSLVVPKLFGRQFRHALPKLRQGT